MKTHVPSPGRLLAAACLAAVALAPSAAQAASETDVQNSVVAGTAWLRAQQNPTTGALTGNFSVDWGLTSLAAGGVHAADMRVDEGPSAQDYYAGLYDTPRYSDPSSPTSSNGAAGGYSNTIRFAHAAGIDPARISPRTNLIAQLAATAKADGSFGTSPAVNISAFSLLALAKTPVAPGVIARTHAFLRGSQHDDGGWNFGAATTPEQKARPSDADTTGEVLAALCDTGATAADPAVVAGAAYLRSRMLPNGAIVGPTYALQNADTNGWAVSGLNACGIDAQGAAWTSAEGKTPVDFLLSLQRSSGPDAGSYKYEPTEADTDPANSYAHQDALRALAGAGFAPDPPARAAGPQVRPVVAPADGTTVPLALSIEDGDGGLQFCRVSAPSAATLPEVLAAGTSAAVPAGCLTAGTSSAGRLTSVNGREGDWRLTLDGGPEAPAGEQRVPWGSVIALRRADGDGSTAGEGTDPGGSTGPDGGTVTAAGSGTGAAPSDGSPTTPPNPVSTPAPPVSLLPSVALPPRKARTLRSLCRRSGPRRVVCRGVTIRKGSRVRLTRRGRLYARGTGNRLRTLRTVRLGHYTLRITRMGKTRKLAIRIR